LQNRILTELILRYPEARGRLTRVDFVHGDLFGRPGEPIRMRCFPCRAWSPSPSNSPPVTSSRPRWSAPAAAFR